MFLFLIQNAMKYIPFLPNFEVLPRIKDLINLQYKRNSFVTKMRLICAYLIFMIYAINQGKAKILSKNQQLQVSPVWYRIPLIIPAMMQKDCYSHPSHTILFYLQGWWQKWWWRCKNKFVFMGLQKSFPNNILKKGQVAM